MTSKRQQILPCPFPVRLNPIVVSDGKMLGFVLQVHTRTGKAAGMSIKSEPVNYGTKQEHFLGSLESCRGVAAMIVAAFHSGQSNWSGGNLLGDTAYDSNHLIFGPISFLYSALCNGHAAVVFFFVLSGFVLSESASRVERLNLAWAGRFFSRRILRIYPPALACIGLFGAIYWVCGAGIPGTGSTTFSPLNILQNLLLIRTDINGVMWTLPIEIVAVPLIGVCIYLVRRKRVASVCLIGLLLTTASFADDWNNLFGHGHVQLQLMYCFVTGVLVHSWWLSSKLVRRACQSNWAFIIAVFTMFTVRPSLGWWTPWSPIFESLLSGVIIAHLTLKARANKTTFLNNPPWRFVGKISYSFYLLHPLSLIVLWRLTPLNDYFRQVGVPSVVVAATLFVVSSLVVMPLAWLSWRFVERASMRVFFPRDATKPADETLGHADKCVQRAA